MANITTSMVDELRANVSGTVAQPGESGYDEAVSIWNASCARRPAIVARCTSSADVPAALHFAKQQNLVVSVRGGGHNYAGGALCDDGLMIDLTPMKAVSVDADARRENAEGAQPGASSMPPPRRTRWQSPADSSVGPVSPD